MKTSQYVRQEKAISVADTSGIRERWMWGLRLLRDTEAMSSPKSLRHGVTDQLIAAAVSGGLRLSAREIQRRLQCARTYSTEAEIRQALADFETWEELAGANFPAYQADEGAPPADHRTEAERNRDLLRAAVDLFGEQGALFPLSDFEPVTATLKELQAYADEMRELTQRFVDRDTRRQDYLDQLIVAAAGDMSVTWQAASDRMGGTA
ncbi:MAG: hypothetical protein JWO11_4454 [Nocardioides sp.]|nr:hypothetical protein [Nocardioides sp.]